MRNRMDGGISMWYLRARLLFNEGGFPKFQTVVWNVYAKIPFIRSVCRNLGC